MIEAYLDLHILIRLPLMFAIGFTVTYLSTSARFRREIPRTNEGDE